MTETQAKVVKAMAENQLNMSRAASERELLHLPGDVRAAMRSIADGMKMPELEGGTVWS